MIAQSALNVNILLTPEATEGLVQNVFTKADTTSSGKITRKALFEALEDEDDEAMELFDINKSGPCDANIKQRAELMKKYIIDQGKIVELPQSQEIIQTVMQVLEQSDKGLLGKKEVASAIQKAAQAQNTFLDLPTTQEFVNAVFATADISSSGVISRSALHEALEHQEEEAFEIFGS